MSEINAVLITGSDGYIGAVMGPMLVAEGFKVSGIDTGFYADCNFGTASPCSFPSLRRDIRDLRPADLAGYDAIIHLAALSNDPLGELKASWTEDINYRASVQLAKMAAEAGVKRFLFSSSCSVYGCSGSDGFLDEQAPLRPVTDYAVSKVRAEQELSRLTTPTFTPVYLRNATAYGISPRLRVDIVLNNLVGWAHLTGAIRLRSDGSSWRPLVHVQDISRAFIAALRAPTAVVSDQAFNVGANSDNYRVRVLAEIVREVMPGTKVEVEADASPDLRSYRVDFAKLARILPKAIPTWDATSGARELSLAYVADGLSKSGFDHTFVRLSCLKTLLSGGKLDDSLRWKGENL